MDIPPFVALFIIALLISAYKNSLYKKSTYYQITKKSYWSLDKGAHGEYLLYEQLRYHEERGGKFLFNLYVPKNDKENTEIDALLITSKGLFVFESKNYNGWIFGDEASHNWTQVLPARRRQSHRIPFYNPIIQNAQHIKHLRQQIGQDAAIWSIIVFSDRCVLKNITVRNKNTRVLNRYDVEKAISQICSEQADTLDESQMNDIYCRLYRYSQTNSEEKELHVKGTKKNSPHLLR